MQHYTLRLMLTPLPSALCTNTQTHKLHPTLHSDHHPAPALLHCRHAFTAAAAKYSNPTLMMQWLLLGELKKTPHTHTHPSPCLSVAQLAVIN